MELDRSQQPPCRSIEEINIVSPKVMTMPNGIELHILDMGQQEVVRVDMMFATGKWHQPKLLVAMFTNLMLKEGVKGMTSQEVAEQLDFYGAWLQPSATFHNSYVTLYSLNKHIEHTLSLLEKIVKEPTFPDEEFQVIRSRRKQHFIIEDEKVDVKAFNKYISLLFGKDCPYGQHAVVDDFDNVERDDLATFHKQCYSSSNCRIFLTGKVTPEILASVEKAFGTTAWGDNSHVQTEKPFEAKPQEFGQYFVEKADALQSGIRIGMPVVGREHEDYAKLRILNTLLGGYFGSRLMNNIREDKGYTYGIGSNITTLKYASYLNIATEVATEYTEPTIKEVKYELERLKSELVQKDEMDTLKGYLMGEMARLFDGLFSIADAHLSLLANDMDVEYYHNMIAAVKSVTAEELQGLAIKYIDVDKLYIVTAGQKAE